MKKKVFKVFVFLFVLAFLPGYAQAMSCHCFTDRDYDPGEPATADPYYLATGQNSFFSVVFQIEKKKLVLAKQKPGTSDEGLWLQHWLARQVDRKPNELRKLKADLPSWGEFLATEKVTTDSLPKAFRDLLTAQANDIQLAHYVVDSLLLETEVVTADELEILRQDGASNREAILASLLGRKTEKTAPQMFHAVERGETTWGTLLLKSGMNGKEMVSEVRTLLKG